MAAGRIGPADAGRDAIVGRGGEVAVVDALVRTGEPADRAVVLEGEPGIGKTVLWEYGVALARSRGLQVLVARPTAHEARLPYAALGDLLEAVPAALHDELAPPQRDALRAALQLEPADGELASLAVGRAVLGLLRLLSPAGAIVVAVDDAQWLDRPSADALEFALRRAAGVDARVLCTRRTGPGGLPLGLERMPSGRPRVVAVGPLDATGLDDLLRARLGLRLARPPLVRLERVTGGNPFYALEVARAVDLRADEPTLPAFLVDVLAARLAGLDSAVRDVLVLAAASAHPTATLVAHAAGDAAGLTRAIGLGLLHRAGDRLRFDHPVLASAVLDQALPDVLVEAHRRLGAVTTDPEARAFHLARSAHAPDEALAATLEEAGRAVAARGGQDAAAELAEAAARLTPGGDEAARRRRLAAAAACHVAAGDPGRARRMLEGLIATSRPGPERAGLLLALAGSVGDSIDEPTRLATQALAEAGGDPDLCAQAHTALGVYVWIAGDLARATHHCEEAVRWAERAGDEVRLAVAVGELCHAQAILGVAWDRAAMDRALAIERRHPRFPPGQRPSFELAIVSLVTDDLDVARPLLEAEVARRRHEGDEPGSVHAVVRLAELELRAGSWAAALAQARNALELARQGGITQEEDVTRMVLGLVLAHVGALDDARAEAQAAYRSATAGGDRANAVRAAGVLGFVALSEGDIASALAWLTPARQELQAMGTGELSISAIVQNEVEALVEADRLDDAEAVVAFVEAKGRAAGRAWHAAIAARGRALVASGRGDHDAAAAALGEAFAAHERLPQPFELARSQLVAGVVERRRRHWATSRRYLTAALEAFDLLGAARWAERAAAELARLPGRRPGTGRLTGTEQQVAALVAEGLTNKEVAARLHVSARTVEANLSRAYAKLGVRSRTELTRALLR